MKKKKDEVQLDLEEVAFTKEQFNELSNNLHEATEQVLALSEENAKLKAALKEKASAESAPQTDSLTRNDVIKHLLPTIRPAFAKSDIELTIQTADAICFAFGIEQ